MESPAINASNTQPLYKMISFPETERSNSVHISGEVFSLSPKLLLQIRSLENEPA